MTKTVVCGALTLNQVTLKLYTHGLVPWEGLKKKKKGKKTLHFARLPLRILQKSLKLFALLWEGVWQQYAATSISTEEIPLVIRRNWF